MRRVFRVVVDYYDPAHAPDISDISTAIGRYAWRSGLDWTSDTIDVTAEMLPHPKDSA